MNSVCDKGGVQKSENFATSYKYRLQTNGMSHRHVTYEARPVEIDCGKLGLRKFGGKSRIFTLFK